MTCNYFMCVRMTLLKNSNIMATNSFTLRGVFRMKTAGGIYVPVYQTQSCDSKNLRGDFKAVGRDMAKAINEAKVRWYGKKS